MAGVVASGATLGATVSSDVKRSRRGFGHRTRESCRCGRYFRSLDFPRSGAAGPPSRLQTGSKSRTVVGASFSLPDNHWRYWAAIVRLVPKATSPNADEWEIRTTACWRQTVLGQRSWRADRQETSAIDRDLQVCAPLSIEGMPSALPFAGGCGVAWSLLLNGYMSEVWINDIDPAIYALWASVLRRTDELCDRLEAVDVTI
jgi:hypothetical protein